MFHDCLLGTAAPESLPAAQCQWHMHSPSRTKTIRLLCGRETKQKLCTSGFALCLLQPTELRDCFSFVTPFISFIPRFA